VSQVVDETDLPIYLLVRKFAGKEDLRRDDKKKEHSRGSFNQTASQSGPQERALSIQTKSGKPTVETIEPGRELGRGARHSTL